MHLQPNGPVKDCNRTTLPNKRNRAADNLLYIKRRLKTNGKLSACDQKSISLKQKKIQKFSKYDINSIIFKNYIKKN